MPSIALSIALSIGLSIGMPLLSSIGMLYCLHNAMHKNVSSKTSVLRIIITVPPLLLLKEQGRRVLKWQPKERRRAGFYYF